MVLSIEHVEKAYDRPVLKDLSCQFESGKLYVIKGVSGCGKSTLLNIIGGVEKDFHGNIRRNGEDVKKGDALRSFAGYIFQYSLLLSNITVFENLLLIRNDPERIERLSREFGVYDLLEKYPEQISGGERQRISVIRALLSDPDLLLADEPTASLDAENSRHMAHLLHHLKEEGKLVIVATHEPYFDELADEILYLDYGRIAQVEKRRDGQRTEEVGELPDGPQEYTPQKGHTQKESSRAKLNLFRFNLRRNPGMLRPGSLLPFLTVFLLILLVSAVQNNFDDAYMRMMKEQYPVDAFNLGEYTRNAFPYKDRLRLYDCYTAEENGMTAYYLADEEDSVLAIDGMLEYGSFPKQENEIIVSRELLEQRYGEEKSFEAYVGTVLPFCGREFVISGILFSMDAGRRGPESCEGFHEYYDSDIYYHHTEGAMLYIPYETIKSFGQLTETEFMRGSYRGLFEDPDALSALRTANAGNTVNIFDEEISMAQLYVSVISAILLAVFFACFLLACIFMSSQIQMELFYRRRELGFLQIFGLSKKRVRKIIFPKYVMKILAGLGLAILLYFILEGAYFLWRGYFAFANLLHVGIVFGAVLVFYFSFASGTLRRFLKQDIIRLITA